MKNTLLIYFSDIHLTGKHPENEGAVIKAFCEDVNMQLATIAHDDAFVLIGGDLVYAADSTDSYQAFFEKILSKLIAFGIRRDKIFCVPGNHDVQRQWVSDNKEIYAPIVNQQFTEERFDNLVGSQQSSLFTEKFTNFSNFVNQYIPNGRFDIFGYPIEVNDDWSLYCLNSALTSFSGLEWGEYPQLKDDKGRLNVDTRRLSEWVLQNTKKKILMMHHPVSFLTEWASDEITKFIRTHFDLVLTGHTHKQNLLCNQISNESYVWCMAPQLFTDKTEKLGYCIIELEDANVSRIRYRQWFESRNCFKQGLDFSDDEIIEINSGKNKAIDPTALMIEERFRDTMAVYGDQSLVWVDRYFSVNRFDRSFSFNKDDLYSEDDIMEERPDLKIVSPAQYGLTSFAWHFILRLWKEKRQFGLFLDCRLIKANRIEKDIKRQLDTFGMSVQQVSWLVFDNWDVSNKDAKVILTYVKENLKDVPIMLLCPMLEKSFIDNENISTYEFSIGNIFMAPMQTSQLRNFVEVYNRKRHIGDDDVVLKRLNDDIISFNMHRTPLNCISLLEVFSNSFDENPVNRTAMIERLLRIIFENEEVPNFKSLPDVKDCEFAIGFYCEIMIREERYYFGSKHFYDTIYNFCRKQKITLDINYLFTILLKNQIICQYDDDIYGFRFAFWVYYFAAMRMSKSKEFADFILNNENYVQYPEVLEFYTGSDRTRDDAAQIVIADLERVTKSVQEKVGVPDKMNPFQWLKLEITDEQAKKAIEKLDENLKQSKLPNNIKDALDDKDYNPSMPFHQDVRKVWENYSVNYMHELIFIASKALRNSDYIAPEHKERLLNAIMDAWHNTTKVVYLMAPALAMDGQAGYDDFRLHLSDGFISYKGDPKGMLIQVMSCIPHNIISWYKDSIYSSKLADLFFEKINAAGSPVIKHLLVSLLVYEMPDRWDEIVRKYLAEVPKASFYFGDTLDSLKSMYARGVMSEPNVLRTKSLIFLAYTKLASKDGKMNQSLVGRVMKANSNLLPKRESDDNSEG